MLNESGEPCVLEVNLFPSHIAEQDKIWELDATYYVLKHLQQKT